MSPDESNPSTPLSDIPGSAVAAYDSGSDVFSRMFSRWMDGNGWSHPTMTQLAAGCLGGHGWLHSSQISGLRHGQTRNPGPRTFVAIERLNYYVWRYKETQQLLPGSESSNHYKDANPLLEDGQPPSLGWFVEVFCGYHVPQDLVLDKAFVPPDKVAKYCSKLGRLVRKLIADQGYDLVEDLSVVLHRFYPTQEQDRIELVEAVIQGRGELSQEQLQAELLSFSKLTGALGGPSTEDALLTALQKA